MRCMVLVMLLAGTYGCSLPCDAVTGGDHVCVTVESSASWAQDKARLTALLEEELVVMAEAQGGSFHDLDGWTIKIVDGNVGCFFADALGCTDPRTKTIAVSSSLLVNDPEQTRCLAATVLAHEVGHVVAGGPLYDVRHGDASWRDAEAWNRLAWNLIRIEYQHNAGTGCGFDVFTASEVVWPTQSDF